MNTSNTGSKEDRIDKAIEFSSNDWEKQRPSDNKFAQQILEDFIHVNERGLWAMDVSASQAIRAIQKYHSILSAQLVIGFADWLVKLKVTPIGGGIWEVHGKSEIAEDGKTGICPIMNTKELYEQYLTALK